MAVGMVSWLFYVFHAQLRMTFIILMPRSGIFKFPIIIEQNTFSTEDHNPKWKLNRANWDLFNTLCTGKLIQENFKESSDPI